MTDDVVVTALVNLFAAEKRHRKPIAMWLERAASAPESAKRLLEAIATYKVPLWEIGRRFIIGGINGTLKEVFVRRGAEPPFDPENTCEIGGSYSEPHISWGFGWPDGALVFIEIEGAAVSTYTPAEWFANLRNDEVTRTIARGKPATVALAAFCEACGDPVPAELLPKPKPKRKKR